MTQHFTLETERLYLRPFKDVDLFPFLQALYDSMAELSPWLEWCDYNFTQDDAKEWIANSSVAWQTNTGYEFAVFDKRSELIWTISQANRPHWRVVLNLKRSREIVC